jgi:hypothetical protein
MMVKRYLLFCALACAVTTTYAANPASKEYVMQEIANSLQPLATSDWNAICSSGTATSATGCYGNVISAAFVKINNYTGGFTRYTNTNPVNAPSSVFVKSFLGGTNTPASTSTINVAVNGSAARCVLFTQNGLAIGPAGVNASSPGNGTTSGAFVPPIAVIVTAINNTSANLAYNQAPYAFATVGGSPNSDPIYLLCVGYNANDNTTAAAISVTAS